MAKKLNLCKERYEEERFMTLQGIYDGAFM